jgi:uncharacterized protein
MTSVRRTTGVLAAVTAAALLLTGCTFGTAATADAGGFAKTEVTVQPLYVKGDSGGVGSETISVSPSKDGQTRVDFSEDQPSGFGDMTRAASWNAVAVTTLLTGAPLDTNYRFAFSGAIDGPSAGALTTVGVLSLYYGDPISKKSTMTGTINPTGTVGVVGGIPEKIQGVIDGKKITKVLIPAGQRNAQNEQGESVDVVALGSRNGVKVVEVGTIYDAYEELTGKKLPTPTEADAPKSSEDAYTKMKSGATEALARFDRSRAQFAGLNALVTGDPSAQGLVGVADADAARARDLQQQGLQAGAFVTANNAAAEMDAIYSMYNTLQSMFVLGDIGALSTQLAAESTAESEFTAQLDSLGTYKPKTLTDVEALVTAYGTALDSYSMLLYANGQLQTIATKITNASYTSLQEILTDVFLPLLYYNVARSQLNYSKSLFDIGRDNGGAKISDAADAKAVGSFLQRAADSNWAAFESGVIQPLAESRGVSNDVFRNRLGSADLSVALSYSAQQTLPQIEDYIGAKNKNSGYAAMGYGWVNYSRNAIHLEKYYNNGVLDENLNVVGVTSDTILSTSLDLGRDQVERATTVLGDHKTQTVIVQGQYEVAGVEREGDPSDKFDAITDYTGAFILSRTQAFLGGYPTDGWSRKA